MLQGLIKSVAPIAAITLLAGLSGCGDVDVTINGEDGVPLSELDMSGPAPTELVLAGPTLIRVSQGDTLQIEVGGDDEAAAALRFTLEDGSLAIMRNNDARNIDGRAEIDIRMPAPEMIVIAGSGEVQADGLATKSELVIAGSGLANVSNIASEQLEVTIAGTGSIKANGKVDSLELNIGGSGNAGMQELTVDRAGVNIAGSGNAEFSSDGEVDASIFGSGNVTVTGSANCTVQSFGSGTISCETVTESKGKKDSDDTPDPPEPAS